MANIIKRVWNQNKMVLIEDLKGMAFQAEAEGHTFEISGIDDDGNPVTFSGTPSGVFLRPDNTDVALTCSISGGKIYATFPATCYSVPGRFGLTIYITTDGATTAVYAAIGTVALTTSGTIAPPATDDVVDLINDIATAVASIPASYSSLLSDIAPDYSPSALYSVGQYVWQEGDLKRCIVPITVAETYTAAHWTSAVLGNDVADLKSAINFNGLQTENKFDYINLFDKNIASNAKLFYNDSTHKFVNDNDRSVVIVEVLPNTTYTISWDKITGNSRYQVITSTDFPAAGVAYNTIYNLEQITGTMRYYKTITTGASDHYLLLYLYYDASKYSECIESVQITNGSTLLDYSGLKFKIKGLYTDEYLKESGIPADAYATGEIINSIKDDIFWINKFDKDSAVNAGLLPNNNKLKFVSDSNSVSYVVPVEPNKKYTVSWVRFDGNYIFKIYFCEDNPAVGSSFRTSIDFSDSPVSGYATKCYKTIETGENDYFLYLLCDSTSTNITSIRETIQVSSGEQLLPYAEYSYVWNKMCYRDIPISGVDRTFAKLLGYRQLGVLEKGYVCLVADDGTADVETVSFPIVREKEVPITFALWSTSACVTDASLFGELQEMISDYGCSVAQHGTGYFTYGNGPTYRTPDQLIQYLNSEETAWETLGVDVKGCVYPNHANDEYVRSICGARYNVCCSGGATGEGTYTHNTLGKKSNIFNLYRINLGHQEQTLKNAIDYANEHNKLAIIWWHDNDIASDTAAINKLKTIIDYAKSKNNIEFITVGDIQGI